MHPSYKRVLLKLSGEILLGSQPFGIDYGSTIQIAQVIKEIQSNGFELAIVIGGGNLSRGMRLHQFGIARTPADQIGMLATLMNGIVLHHVLTTIQCKSSLISAIECPKIAMTYKWEQALKELENGSVLIFAAGTGNPYFTTDTAAALRACEIHADMLLKATKVDGVYDQDPKNNSQAKLFQNISYEKYLEKNLKVMDSTAITLCKNNQVPILVFNMNILGSKSIKDLLSDRKIGTLIS